MVRESDEAGAFNIQLIEDIAGLRLSRGLVVVVEGILNADRYRPMLERLSVAAERALFYSPHRELTAAPSPGGVLRRTPPPPHPRGAGRESELRAG
ncbi:hypothetical protein, partial [Nocardia sp. NPDC005998]|uniref:hypothetical protein n=1 Tax=Nocardia sp. NPDC005998 TaxID=3156894 RepID=UPI0033B46CDA